jgi:integrase
MKVTASRSRRNSSKRSVAQVKKRKERKVKIPLEEDDVQKLKDACETGRETRVIRIFLETGMHPEVMEKPEKHGMEKMRGALTWERPKTEALCVWHYPSEIGGLVDEFLENDLGYERTTYWRLVKRVATRANLKHVSPLTLRHTATVLLLKQMSPESAKRILQCSDRVLWGNYAKLKGLIR